MLVLGRSASSEVPFEIGGRFLDNLLKQCFLKHKLVLPSASSVILAYNVFARVLICQQISEHSAVFCRLSCGQLRWLTIVCADILVIYFEPVVEVVIGALFHRVVKIAGSR